MKFNFFFNFNLIHEMVKTARRAALLGISTNSSRRWVMSLHAYRPVFSAQCFRFFLFPGFGCCSGGSVVEMWYDVEVRGILGVPLALPPGR